MSRHVVPSALIVLLALVFCAGFTAQAQMVLKLSEIHPQGYPTELADEEFARLVNLYTKGQSRSTSSRAARSPATRRS